MKSRHCSCLKNTRINKSTVFFSNINKSSWTRNIGIVFTDYKLFLMEKISVSATSTQFHLMCNLTSFRKKKNNKTHRTHNKSPPCSK